MRALDVMHLDIKVKFNVVPTWHYCRYFSTNTFYSYDIAAG